MHVGKLLLKMGQSEWPCSLVGKEIYDFLEGVDDLVVELVLFLYVGMDWRGCVNINFTKDTPCLSLSFHIFIFSHLY